jgi:hypothetical protein
VVAPLALLSLLAATEPVDNRMFPERTPEMIQACLVAAVANGEVSKTKDAHKYICGGAPAEALWLFLESQKIESWDQTVDSGVWRSRQFPLGGCFKRVANRDGSEAPSGLSCTIWIPRR